MTSTVFKPFGPLRPLLLCIVFVSGYSETLLATDNESIPYPTRDHHDPVTEPATLEYKWKHIEGAEEYAFSIRDHRLTRDYRLADEPRSKGIIYNSDETIRLMAADPNVCSEETGICKVSTADTVLLETFGRYSWRVKAFKAGKRIGVKRNVFFVSAGELPPAPEITSPTNNTAHTLAIQPSFEWSHSLASSSGDADHYIVRVVDITTKGDRKLVYRSRVPTSVCESGSCSYTFNENDVVAEMEPPAENDASESLEIPLGNYRFTVRASNGYDRSTVARSKFTVASVPEAEATEGYDWSLPGYVSENANTRGGLVRDTYPEADKPEGYTNTVFYSMRWYLANTAEGIYDFKEFDGLLADSNVLVRLDVSSVCDTPHRLREDFDYYATHTIAFWQEAYLVELEKFVNEFAAKYANNPRVVGVHLGMADGEYKSNDINLCTKEIQLPDLTPTTPYNIYEDDDGWGEFNAKESELESALNLTVDGENQGLTVSGVDEFTGEVNDSVGNFKESVERIISIYTNAFGENSSKLAMTNLGDFVYNEPGVETVPDSVINQFNLIKVTEITPNALEAGVGNRDGLIEDWMAYNDPVYGVHFESDPTKPNNTCKITMNESHAEKYADNRFWGTENEEYGNADYVTKKFGSYESQPYRFMMSSLRALQMRRNHIQLNTDAMFDMTLGESPLSSEYDTAGFMHYLAATIGRSKADTPDAFVLLGERYIRPVSQYVSGYDGQVYGDSTGVLDATGKTINEASEAALDNCAMKNENGTPLYYKVSEYGRWLTEVSGEGTKANLVDLDYGLVDPKTKVRKAVEPWSIPRYLPEVTVATDDVVKTTKKYEYAARANNEFQFDINDTVVANRCDEGAACHIEVKVVFQDTVATTLSLVTEAGVVGAIETDGLQGTKTVTFNVEGTFNNGLENGADFALVTSSETDTLPVFMARVNFLNEPASGTPVLAVVAPELN